MQHDDVLDHLPHPLRERCRWIRWRGRTAGQFVVYWMQTAMRVDENPAFEVAKSLANNWRLPLLVYQGLSQRYRYASDRHHTFILEGAEDIQSQLSLQGISYGLYVETVENSQDHLGLLADQASIVIAEDMPTRPSTTFRKALARRSHCSILAVDTSCIAPMCNVGKAYDRAFQFRDAAHDMQQSSIDNPWSTVEPIPRPFDLKRLPFAPVELSQGSIADLVAKCDIDHGVGPILDTRGGSIAGYRRWEHFVSNKLSKYARLRNSPLADGVSRMSAYLHYGMVSPFRIAREAHQQDNDGARKFLDELLVWRELAYSFCFYRTDHERWSVIPAWARETLLKHRRDARGSIYSWEQLARAQTHDRLWNAAQQSLLLHGELHNNVRMTWGKAILEWVEDPVDAMQLMIDLNHRYALDGRDPCSYGGLLWCLGLFDRPFEPEIPILGIVRPRPTGEHAKRLDLDAYSQRTARTRCSRPPVIAVIGAGIAGAMAARTLSDHGLSIKLLDKSRGVGGRMATRHYDFGDFDHGAQYFTARNASFRRYVESWKQQGIVAKWNAKIVAYHLSLDNEYRISQADTCDRFVGVPAMNSVVKQLSQGLDVQLGTEVSSIESRGDQLCLRSFEHELGEFDRVIIAIPAPQAQRLLSRYPSMVDELSSISMQPCWCMLIRLNESLPVEWGGAFVNGGPLRWISRNQTKPGRGQNDECIVIHASSEWSAEHLALDESTVQQLMLKAFWKTIGLVEKPIAFATVHRWRYSIAEKRIEPGCVFNPQKSIVVCGDWAGGPKVEGAFLSGSAAAGVVLRSLLPAEEPLMQTFLF